MSDSIKQRLNNLEHDINAVKQKSKTKIVENHSDIDELQQEVEAIQNQLKELSEIQSKPTKNESVDENPEIKPVQQKLTLLAHNIIQIRSTLNELSASITNIQDKVNIHFKIIHENISSLLCNACENTIEITDLDTLECPHCNRQFTDIEVTNRFLRSNIGKLHTDQ